MALTDKLQALNCPGPASSNGITCLGDDLAPGRLSVCWSSHHILLSCNGHNVVLQLTKTANSKEIRDGISEKRPKFTPDHYIIDKFGNLSDDFTGDCLLLSPHLVNGISTRREHIYNYY